MVISRDICVVSMLIALLITTHEPLSGGLRIGGRDLFDVFQQYAAVSDVAPNTGPSTL